MTATSNKLENLYPDLRAINDLLQDICDFITNDVNISSLTPQAEKKAQLLIKRSQAQLSVLHTAVAAQKDAPSYPYISMKRSLPEKDFGEYVFPTSDHDNNYEMPQPDANINMDSLIITKDVCDYYDLPAPLVPEKAIKYGPLSRKERRFFIGQYKKCYAGLISGWLLVYDSDKDLKPSQIIDVSNYVAQTFPAKDQRKNATFDIMCVGCKSYQFTARTPKDMEQWIAAINTEIQKYPVITNENEEGNIYEKLAVDDMVHETSVMETGIPQLPPRRPIKKEPSENDMYDQCNTSEIQTPSSNYNNVESSNYYQDDELDIYDSVRDPEIIPNSKREDEIFENKDDFYDEDYVEYVDPKTIEFPEGVSVTAEAVPEEITKSESVENSNESPHELPNKENGGRILTIINQLNSVQLRLTPFKTKKK